MAKVCISMCTYDGLELLREVSIPSLLAQTYQDWHLYIVQDGDRWVNQLSQYSDLLQDMVDGFGDDRITILVVDRVLPDPPFEIGSAYWNVAGFNAINYGLQVISQDQKDCEFIACLDQDDAWLPDHLTALVAALNNNQADLAYSGVQWHYGGAQAGMLGTGEFSKERLKSGNFIAHSSILYRANCGHDYLYSGDTSMPSDYRHLLSFDGDFKKVDQCSVLYFQKCSIGYSKRLIAEWNDK